MDGEEPGELAQALGQGRIEAGEGAQVLGDAGQLRVVLAQQALGDHVGDILARDAHLLEAIAHPVQLVGHEAEAWVVEERLLDACQEAQRRQCDDLAQLAQEAEIQDQRTLFARAQVIQQFIHDQQQP